MDVEPYWPGLFAKALEGVKVKDLITNVGSGVGAAPAAAAAAPAAAAAGGGDKGGKKKEEKKEESEEEDDDMGFGTATYLLHYLRMHTANVVQFYIFSSLFRSV